MQLRSSPICFLTIERRIPKISLRFLRCTTTFWRECLSSSGLSGGMRLDEAVEVLAAVDDSDQTILAVVAPRGNETWYFRLMGENELADREKDNFEKFVNSADFK